MKVKNPETKEFQRFEIYFDERHGQLVGFTREAVEDFGDNLVCPFKGSVTYCLGLASLQAAVQAKTIVPPEIFDPMVALAAFYGAIHARGMNITQHVSDYLVLHWRYFSPEDRSIIAAAILESLAKGEHSLDEIEVWKRILDLPVS